MKYPLEKNTLFLIIIAILLISLIAVFFFQKRSSLEPTDPSLLLEKKQTQIAVSSDEEAWDEIALPKIAPEKPTGTAASKIKLLNANATTANLKDGEGKKMSGLRILGEIQNMGNKMIENAIVLVNFYGADEALMDTKIGVWHQDYKFLSLAPGEINIYEVLIPEPPTSESVTVGIQSIPLDQANSPIRLEIKSEKLEGAVLEKDGQQIHYFKFTGTLVNNNDFAVVNPGIYVWIKDDKDKVISASYKTFNDKRLEKGEELNVRLDLLPLSSESKVAYHTRGRAFAENL